MKKFWLSLLRCFSTSKTLPNLFPTSSATWEVLKSKGAPQIWTHKDIDSNLTFVAAIPDSHLVNNNAWLSKHQRPSVYTLSNSNSDLNLNWNRFDPTLTTCTPSSSPHAFFIVLSAALLLNGLQVKNLPIRLKAQLSNSSLRPSSDIGVVPVGNPKGKSSRNRERELLQTRRKKF